MLFLNVSKERKSKLGKEQDGIFKPRRLSRSYEAWHHSHKLMKSKLPITLLISIKHRGKSLLRIQKLGISVNHNTGSEWLYISQSALTLCKNILDLQLIDIVCGLNSPNGMLGWIFELRNLNNIKSCNFVILLIWYIWAIFPEIILNNLFRSREHLIGIKSASLE